MVDNQLVSCYLYSYIYNHDFCGRNIFKNYFSAYQRVGDCPYAIRLWICAARIITDIGVTHYTGKF